MTAYVNLSRPKRRTAKRRNIANASINRPKRERTTEMTAEQAKSFTRFSLANMATVLGELEARGACTGHCMPYQDVFTFARWKALGCSVKKGEHGVRLPVIVQATKTRRNDAGEDEAQTFTIDRTVTVFCSCQVTGDYVHGIEDGPDE